MGPLELLSIQVWEDLGVMAVKGYTPFFKAPG